MPVHSKNNKNKNRQQQMYGMDEQNEINKILETLMEYSFYSQMTNCQRNTREGEKNSQLRHNKHLSICLSS